MKFDSAKIAEALLHEEENAPTSQELARIMGVSLDDFLAEEKANIGTADTIPAPKAP